MAEKAGVCRLHRAALALCGTELVLLGVMLLGGTPAVYPLLILLFPTLALVVMDSLRLRGTLSGREWRSSAWYYCANLSAIFLLICFGGWLRTIFDFSDVLETITERNLILLGLGYLTEAVVLLEVWLTCMVQGKQRLSHAPWFYVLGTAAIFLLFLLGDYTVNHSVNWVIAMVQSLVMAEGWLLIRVLKWLLQPERDGTA